MELNSEGIYSRAKFLFQKELKVNESYLWKSHLFFQPFNKILFGRGLGKPIFLGDQNGFSPTLN
ncbi:MAG: hypothetical protein A2007_02225 [Verrucomicrobia bacterium GWC2_42_7]|nr:MAG: hypothetical protein A2007_02225 [Verrucomicrobia bacterium GWC2_42_7]